MIDELITAAFYSLSADRFFALLSSQNVEWTLEEQRRLSQLTWKHSTAERFPRNVAFCRQILKRFVLLLESRGLETEDSIYNELTRLMLIKEENDDFYTYFFPEKQIVVESSTNIVEQATTGLYCWPAAKQFANFALENKSLFENKSIVELGAGTGLTGIILKSFCNPKQYLFTDHSECVLKLVAQNLRINNVTDQSSLKLLDWTDDGESFSHDVESCAPEVVVACDVIFDESVLPGLCRLLNFLLNRFRVTAFLLSTIRNVETVLAFEKQLTCAELSFKKFEMTGNDEAPFFVGKEHKFVLHIIQGIK